MLSELRKRAVDELNLLVHKYDLLCFRMKYNREISHFNQYQFDEDILRKPTELIEEVILVPWKIGQPRRKVLKSLKKDLDRWNKRYITLRIGALL